MMNKWEHRQYAKFEHAYGFFRWKSHPWSPETQAYRQEVSYVREEDVCAFLGLSVFCWRILIAKALAYHQASPSAYIFLVPESDGRIGYRWEALDGIITVPGLLARRHRVKVRAVMERLYELQRGDEYRYRHETWEESLARYDQKAKQLERAHRKRMRIMNAHIPGYEQTMKRIAHAAWDMVQEALAGAEQDRDAIESRQLLALPEQGASLS